MTKEGGEPNKEPAVNRTPSPAKHNANKTKRLLPMELRKRRRAAKLQVSAEKKARVAFAASPVPPTPSHTTSSPNKATEEKQPEKTSPAKAGDIISPMQATLLQSKASGSTRLKMLYASSLNPQRRQLIPGGNVPNTFHIAELPLDSVPKTKLSILTAFPFPFQRLKSKVKKQALQSFISASDSSAKPSSSQSTAVRWQQALHYFMHPANSVPTSLLLNRATIANTSEPLLGGPKGERKREEKAFFTARWNTWQEAFRDVYLNFRRYATSKTASDALEGSFYLRSSEFVVHFLFDPDRQHASGNGTSIINLCRQYDQETGANEDAERTKNSSLRAVMSQSSARIRKVLHHLNVDYTMPYIKANQSQQEVGEFHLLEEELEASRKRNQDRSGGSIIAPVTGTTAPESMHGADSLLLFHDHDAVHGLYEFLINRAPMSNQDVPELYALHPFTNASIQTLQAKSYGRVGVAAPDSASEGSSRSASLFRVEILGFCFPSSVVKLLAVLKDEWEAASASYDSSSSGAGGNNAQAALRVYMEAMVGAERLNAVNLNDEQVANGRGGQQEQQKRQQQLEFSKRRMETAVVTKVEGHYDVETTIRVTAVRR